MCCDERGGEVKLGQVPVLTAAAAVSVSSGNIMAWQGRQDSFFVCKAEHNVGRNPLWEGF